jgi:hypothetical protein
MDKAVKHLLQRHGFSPSKMKLIGVRPLDEPTPIKQKYGCLGRSISAQHNLESTKTKLNTNK